MYKGEGREILNENLFRDIHFEMMTFSDVIDWSRYWRGNYKIQLLHHHSYSFIKRIYF